MTDSLIVQKMKNDYSVRYSGVYSHDIYYQDPYAIGSELIQNAYPNGSEQGFGQFKLISPDYFSKINNSNTKVPTYISFNAQTVFSPRTDLDPLRQSIGSFWKLQNQGSLNDIPYLTFYKHNSGIAPFSEYQTINIPSSYNSNISSMTNDIKTFDVTEEWNERWADGAYSDTFDLKRKATRMVIEFNGDDLLQNRLSMVSLFSDVETKNATGKNAGSFNVIITKDDLPEVIKINAILEVLKGELKLIQSALENLENGTPPDDPQGLAALGLAEAVEQELLQAEADLNNEDLDDNGIPKGKINKLQYLLDQIPDPTPKLVYPKIASVVASIDGNTTVVAGNYNYNSYLKKGDINLQEDNIVQSFGYTSFGELEVSTEDDWKTELFKEVITNNWETYGLYAFNQLVRNSTTDAFYDFDNETYRYPVYVDNLPDRPKVLNKNNRYSDTYFSMNLLMSPQAMTFVEQSSKDQQYVDIKPVYNYYSRYYEESTKQGEVNVYGSNELEEIPETFYPTIYDVPLQTNEIEGTGKSLISAAPSTEGEFSKFKFEDFGHAILNCGLGAGSGYTKWKPESGPLKNQSGIRNYFNVLVDSIDSETMLTYDSLKRQFPFFVDLEFKTDNKTQYSEIFNKSGMTGVLIDMLISNFFDYTKQNTNIVPSKDEPIGSPLSNLGTQKYYDPYDSISEYKNYNGKSASTPSAAICYNNIYNLKEKNKFVKYYEPTKSTAKLYIDTTTEGQSEYTREFDLNEFLHKYIGSPPDDFDFINNIIASVPSGYSKKIITDQTTNALSSEIAVEDTIDFIDKYGDISHDKFRNYFEVLKKQQSYNETLFYRVEKRAVTLAPYESGGDTIVSSEVVQNIWFVKKDTEEDVIKYIDTQVKYGKDYEYIIYAYQIVVGTKYGFQFENYPYKDAPWTDNYDYLPIPEDREIYDTIRGEDRYGGSVEQNLERTTEGESSLGDTEIDIPGFQQEVGINDFTEPKKYYFNKILYSLGKLGFGLTSGDLVYNGQIGKPYYFQVKDQKFGSNVFFKSTTADSPKNAVIFDVICEPDVKLIEVPIYKKVVTISDAPSTPPEVDILPLNGKNNEIKINFYPGTVDRELLPISILIEDGPKFANIRKAQDRNLLKESKSQFAMAAEVTNFPSEYYVEPRLMFKSDDFAIQYEIYRLETPPGSYYDFGAYSYGDDSFASSNRVVIDAKKQSSYTDKIEQNKKYYYTFRSIDVHQNPSNPSPIYQVEMVENSGASYPIISIYNPPQESKNIKSKPFKRYLKIDPAPMQNTLNIDESGLENAFSATYVQSQNIVLGEKEDKIFNYLTQDGNDVGSKKFKFRLKSKHTGKIVDLNVKFKIRSNSVNQNIPSCGNTGYVEYKYPEITSDDLE